MFESVSASYWFLVCLGVISVILFPHGVSCRSWFPEVNGVISTAGSILNYIKKDIFINIILNDKIYWLI